jgi:3-phenylpropionate/trans-cinnamate dioxygenase ferredoxin subunit
LPEGKPVELALADRKIGMLRQGAEVYAFTALCPHAGAPLCEGWLDATGKLVCPLHKYRFDAVTGRNTSGEGYKLFTYPVELRDGEIFVGLPETNF